MMAALIPWQKGPPYPSLQGKGQTDAQGALTQDGSLTINDRTTGFTVISTSGDGVQIEETNSGGIFIGTNGGLQIDSLPAFAGGDQITLANLPVADPHTAGQLWNNAGVLHVSAG